MRTLTHRLGVILIICLLLMGFTSTASSQAPPPKLRAPWDHGDWWQPSTYISDKGQPHPPLD